MPIIPASCMLALETALTLCLCSIPPQTASAANPSRDACSLFTASQVSKVLGITVTDGQHPVPSSLLLCAWAPAGTPQPDGKKLSVNLMTERAFEVGKASVHGTGKAPVSGGTYVQIWVGGFPTQKQKELEKALALQMLTKR
jgi:hypothetical protein